MLVKCSEVIESHGIVDGVYRLSGMSSNIQKLRLVAAGRLCQALPLLIGCKPGDCCLTTCKQAFWGGGRGGGGGIGRRGGQIARILIRVCYDTNSDPLIDKLGWRKLDTQRQIKKVTMVYKSLIGIVPNYLRSKFAYHSSVTNYSLRNTNGKLAIPLTIQTLRKIHEFQLL